MTAPSETTRTTRSGGEAERISTWHTMEVEAVLDHLRVMPDGLNDDEVARRQEEYGRNVFPEKEPLSLARIILHQFLNPLIYILVIAAVISIVIREIADAIFIVVVILLNAGLGSFQEYRAERSAAALQSLLKIFAKVRRDGRQIELDAEELVPGDIVALEPGDRVPADTRLINVVNLAVDESFLTGESVAAQKNVDAMAGEDIPVADRRNMAFAGATAMSGRAQGVVVATGLHTELGRIAEAAATRVDTTKPPLVIRMERFVRHITFVILGAVAILVAVSLYQGVTFQEIFFLAVALAVSAIPEGLPVTMTVALSIAVYRMVRRHVIVRRMTAVEGLGSCTYIASDKTGTLTVNKQTVKRIALPSAEHFTVAGEGYVGEGEVQPHGDGELSGEARAQLEQLAKAAVICNDGSLARRDGEWKHHGDAVDVALLAFGYKIGCEAETIQRRIEIVGEIPFDSERKYAAKAYREDGHVRVAVKGAVEALLPFCHSAQSAAEVSELDAAAVEAEADRLAEDGYRVLAVASGRAEDGARLGEFAEEDMPPLTLLGVVGMIDPLRPEAKDAVQTCHQAGIEVAMVTGDHPATAFAIARELGIAKGQEDIVTGRELAQLEPHDSPAFTERAGSVHVFARVSPMQKLHIVEALSRQGHFIAVTGDGVNDAPALSAANIGVAMGSGTDVAKDAASIIVTDDNFASIVDGVEEGRFAYSNLRKVIYLLISTGAAEIVLFLTAIFSGLPLPLLPVQILWLNLVTNGVQDKTLAFEPGEADTMKRPPRRPTEGIFNRQMISQVAISGATMGLIAYGCWYWLLGAGWGEAAARNLVLLLMVLFQNFHLFNCRSEDTSTFRLPLSRNWLLVLGALGALGIHFLAMYLPFMQVVLDIEPVSLGQFLTLLAIASTVLVVMEVFKLVRGRVDRTAMAWS